MASADRSREVSRSRFEHAGRAPWGLTTTKIHYVEVSAINLRYLQINNVFGSSTYVNSASADCVFLCQNRVERSFLSPLYCIGSFKVEQAVFNKILFFFVSRFSAIFLVQKSVETLSQLTYKTQN